LLHDQELTRQELVDVSRRIGDTNDSNPSMGHMEFNPKDTPDMSIITNQPTGNDPHGMFGPSDLLYHHDFGVCHFGEFKELLTGLYCVGSCPDTVLSLMNTQIAFNYLTEEQKEWWRNVETQLNQGSHGIYGTPEAHKEDSSLNGYKVFKHNEERQKVINAKRAAGAKGKYKRSSKSNVTGTSSGGSLKTWVKQDWRQVGNPSKKCGEK